MLLVEEFFSTEDDRFLDALRHVDQPKLLAAFADRWKTDKRPWARRQQLAYAELPFDRPGHQPVVRRLFKHAEASDDAELMARFLVAFDVHVRRKLATRWQWDFRTRTSYNDEVLAVPRDVIPTVGPTYRDPATGRLFPSPEPLSCFIPRNGRLFRYASRYYLRRRAWRHFRKIGYRDPTNYPVRIAMALRLYRDEHLAAGENILDSRGLLHACFGEHEALEFGPAHAKLKADRSFAELASAPMFPETWRRPESGLILFDLLLEARSRLVRVWARQTLEREHPGFAAPVEALLRLLDHDDEELQQLGSKLLSGLSGLETRPLDFWLRLLATRNAEALAQLCDLFRRHVTSERLSLAHCVDLANQRATSVSRLGLAYLHEKTIATSSDRAELTRLASTQCGAASAELARFALIHLGNAANYSADTVIAFFDSVHEPARQAAWEWLATEGSPGADDPVLWSRLIETPYHDLRLRLVERLDHKATLPAGSKTDLSSLWATVLLGVHRGGRLKAKAVHQIGDAILGDPERADTLLPVLAVAVRSVRGPEMRAGLAAVAGLLERRPELTEPMRRHLPELTPL